MYYLLGENRNPYEVSFEEWVNSRRIREGRVERVAQTMVGEDAPGQYRVSTVFLGIDHSFIEQGPPVLFETMIFGGPPDNTLAGDYCERYTSWDAALAGHANAVQICLVDLGLAEPRHSEVGIPTTEDTAPPRANTTSVEERIYVEFLKVQKATSQSRMLTDEARERAEAFLDSTPGCSCHKGHAPCGHCTHPDNPANMYEQDYAWRDKTRAEKLKDRGRLRVLGLGEDE